MKALGLLFLLGCGPVRCEPAEDTPESTHAESERPRTADGYEIVSARTKRAPEAPPASENLVIEPTSPDPMGGNFTLEQAVAEMPLDGPLVAEIGTDLGTLFCDLFADKAPRTVANFIGLARGRRSFWDPRAAAWTRRPFYRGATFHRVLPGFLIQTGDLVGDGTGGPGYTIPDEIHETLRRHDRAGQLCMASSGRNENGSQFFITDAPAPQLDASDDGRTYPIFGQCRPPEIVQHIARVPQDEQNRPLTPVRIDQIRIRRVAGGAAAATVTPPTVPPELEGTPHNASPGPAELRQRLDTPRDQRQVEQRP